MGGCCFTPTKRDFLWWYWLLLASIVGIPMLLAVWYVARGSEETDEEKRRRGKTAAWIFWCGTFAVAIVSFFAVDALLEMFYRPSESFWQVREHFTGWVCLAVQFFFATVAANGANSLIQKRPWFARIPLLVLCIAFYAMFVEAFGPGFRRPAIHIMQFMACMLPAHHWGLFKDTPDTRHAWNALWAFLVASGLFLLVSYFGEDFGQLVCGPPRLWWK